MNPAAQEILIVDDEQPIRRFLRTVLTEQGYKVSEAETGRKGVAMASNTGLALILLDLGLPDLDGLEVLSLLRGMTEAPIIVLSARETQEAKIAALDGGAVDYLTKPFGVGELAARIRVALRLAAAKGGPPGQEVVSGELRVDLANRQVHLRGQEIRLTPIEFNLLAYLAKNAGKVVTHRQLLQAVWGPNATDKEHYLRIYIHQLRHKIEPIPSRPRFVRTESGVGYRFLQQDEAGIAGSHGNRGW
ncbi:MAG: response regulator [Solidesulfovibrio sp.]|uniref:response regulator n=1 Tax=Solidesulfovibrio sp. TaxID=2910990 RepID=UPI002B1F0771|nr:response regulator [Solidesulfovibrio sp.]MEA4855435.1 response regulator [Solidesulfovibrio sp.]